MIMLLTFLALSYTVFVVAAILGWNQLQAPQIPAQYEPRTPITVLIAVRNEAENLPHILHDLADQRFPQHLFEVIFVDDHSEDESAAIIQDFVASTKLNIKLLHLPNGRGAGKKSAIAFGLQHASGQLIVQTDGDCRLQPEWLRLFEFMYVSEGVKFISGPVCLTAGNSIFQKLQLVEFASLIGSGAASIALGRPNMCNGANLAYEKAAFYAVSGFTGNEGIASGDDEFLMHKIQVEFPGKVKFLKAGGAVVYTPALSGLRQFVAQRVRWASKWKHYRNIPAQILAVLVFGINFMLTLTGILWLSGHFEGNIFWSAFLLKTTADFVFLGFVLRFFHRSKYLIYMLPLQLVYMPYVVFTAMAGLFGTYHWKGRLLKNHDGIPS